MDLFENELIAFDDIDIKARKFAVEWCENYNPSGIDIIQKHKLASDVMNYARQDSLEFIRWCIKMEIEPISKEYVTVHSKGGSMASPIMTWEELYNLFKKQTKKS